MKSKFQKKKDREKRVRKKVLLRREAIRKQSKVDAVAAAEVKQFEREARLAESNPSPELERLLVKVSDTEKNSEII
jgi:hypothetical protein